MKITRKGSSPSWKITLALNGHNYRLVIGGDGGVAFISREHFPSADERGQMRDALQRLIGQIERKQ